MSSHPKDLGKMDLDINLKPWGIDPRALDYLPTKDQIAWAEKNLKPMPRDCMNGHTVSYETCLKKSCHVIMLPVCHPDKVNFNQSRLTVF